MLGVFLDSPALMTNEYINYYTYIIKFHFLYVYTLYTNLTLHRYPPTD